jgi:hypothetical protein
MPLRLPSRDIQAGTSKQGHSRRTRLGSFCQNLTLRLYLAKAHPTIGMARRRARRSNCNFGFILPFCQKHVSDCSDCILVSLQLNGRLGGAQAPCRFVRPPVRVPLRLRCQVAHLSQASASGGACAVSCAKAGSGTVSCGEASRTSSEGFVRWGHRRLSLRWLVRMNGRRHGADGFARGGNRGRDVHSPVCGRGQRHGVDGFAQGGGRRRDVHSPIRGSGPRHRFDSVP